MCNTLLSDRTTLRPRKEPENPHKAQKIESETQSDGLPWLTVALPGLERHLTRRNCIKAQRELLFVDAESIFLASVDILCCALAYDEEALDAFCFSLIAIKTSTQTVRAPLLRIQLSYSNSLLAEVFFFCAS